jgi:hypothetical protein
MIRPSCAPVALDFVNKGFEPVVCMCWLFEREMCPWAISKDFGD